ncbi:hypothetical protein D3C87_144610 [compost metagenome]
MKVLLFALTLVTSLSSFADLKVETTLDFRSAYGNFNAGLYKVTTEFVSKVTPSKSVVTKTQHRDDGELYCILNISFEVGTMKNIFENLLTGETFSVARDVQAYSSYKHPGQECTETADLFVQDPTLYLVLTTGSVVLPVTAPEGYNAVNLWYLPFQYLSVKADIKKVGEELEIQPLNILTVDSLFGAGSRNNWTGSYYLTATKRDTTLSLAVGTSKTSEVK